MLHHTYSAIHTTHKKGFALVRHESPDAYRLSYFEGSTYVEIEVKRTDGRITAQCSLRWENWNDGKSDKELIAWTTLKHYGLFKVFQMMRAAAYITHTKHVKELSNV